MARGKYFTEYERELIRIGTARGLNPSRIAKAIGRTPQGVRKQVQRMQERGAMAVSVFAVVADADAEEVFGNE